MKAPSMRRVLVAIYLMGCSFVPLAVSAQGNVANALNFGNLVKQRTPAVETQVSGYSSCAGLSGGASAACQQWQKAMYEHQVWIIEYRQRAYEAHHIYTIIVFAIVCALVLLGMYLSWREFSLGAKRRESLLGKLLLRTRKPAATDPAEGKAPEVMAAKAEPQAGSGTQLELNAQGVKVSSQVLGVVVLIISMGFFYLYLKTVYPIQENATVIPQQVEVEKGNAEAAK